MELFGYELENVGVVLGVYIFLAFFMLWVFKRWANAGADLGWGIKIITFVVGLPITYFIINHFANKGG